MRPCGGWRKRTPRSRCGRMRTPANAHQRHGRAAPGGPGGPDAARVSGQRRTWGSPRSPIARRSPSRRGRRAIPAPDGRAKPVWPSCAGTGALPAGAGFEFVNRTPDGMCCPQRFVPAVERGVRESLDSGVLAGYPLVDLQGRAGGRDVRRGRVHRVGLQGRRPMAFRNGAASRPARCCWNR